MCVFFLMLMHFWFMFNVHGYVATNLMALGVMSGGSNVVRAHSRYMAAAMHDDDMSET